MASQFDARGRLRHLITLEHVSRAQLVELLDRAESFLTPAGDYPARSSALAGRTVANLFFEPSTRTRASFELAARRLGADVLSLDVSMSSRAKGESLLDTIYTLQAMQVDVFVIRDAQSGVPAFICEHVAPHVAVLNAGESHLNHPTQGLLDVLTMRLHKGGFENLVVTIAGDIQHSRVARSAHHALMTLGIGELRLVAPPALAPRPGRVRGRADAGQHRGRRRRRRRRDVPAHPARAHGSQPQSPTRPTSIASSASRRSASRWRNPTRS
jgi:aspartate carbamoyltransferase catalytic subunit